MRKDVDKRYLCLNIYFDPEGNMIPVSIVSEAGRIIQVDKLLEVKLAGASCPDKQYTVQINGRYWHIYFESGSSILNRTAGRWYFIPGEKSVG